MGTNYYLKSKPCQSCGHSKTEKHIGKSSFGWQFHFRGYREDPLVCFKEWLVEMQDPNKMIVDEYGEIYSLDEFKTLIQDKKDGINHFNAMNNLVMNEKEENYLKKHPSKQYGNHDYSKSCWKDDEGYAFTDWEFC